MSRRIHAYVDPRRFVAGTVGLPGERTFYLQASDARSVTSVALEKSQVAMLAERIERLQAEGAGGTTCRHESTGTPGEGGCVLGCERDPQGVGGLRIIITGLRGFLFPERVSLDQDASRDAFIREERDPQSPDAELLFQGKRQGLVVVATRSVGHASLRDQPLDPGGHVCPRANGYRRRA